MRRGNPRRPSGTVASWTVILAIIAFAQVSQTAAFSPSSLKSNGLLNNHATTKSWREKNIGGSIQPNNNNNKESDLARRTARVSNVAMHAAPAAAASAGNVVAPISPSNLAVSLDRPLLSPVEYTYRAPASATKGVWSSLLAVLLSDVFKTALVAFVLAVGVSFLPKLFHKVAAGSGGKSGGVRSAISDLASRIIAPIQSLLPTKSTKGQQPRVQESYSEPMPFEGDGGWGKCTLRSTKSVGTNTIYEFALPESYYTIPATLGQQLDFCCLSADDEICTGSFYPFEDGKKDNGAGVVRVVLPNDGEKDEGSSKFNEVLRSELRPGDEVAVKPGKSRLAYDGKHVPVTDMVYLASGLGIVPILDQVRATMPKGSSSVKVATVTWFNEDRDDFDLAMDDLEAEYLKHPTKLAVSCILDDITKNPLEGNKEVEEAVPYFNAGTMAVVCGPKRFAEKAKGYLMRRGYPENCVCVLP